VSDVERVWCIGVTASDDRGTCVRVKCNVAATNDESDEARLRDAEVSLKESDGNERLLERVLLFNTSGEWTVAELSADETDNLKLLDFVRDAEAAVVIAEGDATLLTRTL
jgi:hypothetical protein